MTASLPRDIHARHLKRTRGATAFAFSLLLGLSLGLLPTRSNQGGRLVAAEDDELRVLPPRAAADRRPSALYLRLQQSAGQAIAARRTAYESLKTREQIATWQRQRREIMLRSLGELPGFSLTGTAADRGPLAPQVTGAIDGDGYRIEKVIFQSRPGHHITANLYLPKSPPPFPGVIVPCGHSFNGKAADGYQRVSILLARHGIAALCYDPIGQGERYQTFDKDGRPLGLDYHGGASSVKQLAEIPGQPHFNPVEEHTLIGLGALLVGTNAAYFRIWDGLRATDYLASRSDIDSQRLGCTGNSGGGTLTAYLMALDDRIQCAAPTCYLTSFDRLLATSGPQDAEQNLFGQIADGLDEVDYVLVRAPKPTLLCAGTRDATFDITGTWEILRDAKRIYGRLGLPERVDIAEADEPHGFTQPLRTASTRWMRRWLLGVDDAVFEPELAVHSASELQCTPRGQVMWMPGERSVFDLLRGRNGELRQERETIWNKTPRDQIADRVRQLTGVRRYDELPPSKVTHHEPLERFGAKVRRATVEDGATQLPVVAFVPAGWKSHVIYLHSDGKHVAARPGGPIEKLVKQGVAVVAVDLDGLGETQVRHPRDWGRELFGPNTQEFFLAYLQRQSVVGIHVENIWAITRSLDAVRGDGSATAVRPRLIAEGPAAGVAALHAAALAPDRFESLELHGSLSSWTSVIESPAAGHCLPQAVHAALTTYDLPDLAKMLPKNYVKSVDEVDAKHAN